MAAFSTDQSFLQIKNGHQLAAILQNIFQKFNLSL